ncbi:ABC transporter ATP-binding protein [uncultured Adlercreutzia sp.]|uniref:ABC transporter ATP-binding protein n=1 Tax=uncultured Adlercreutzia sp. TaxID=875803 RepID=UPI0026F3C8FC|nr:ATP-binding cassette domain-containing protein [uncultured Adlercreutzia sp.]
MNAIVTEKLSKSFKGVEVVKGLDMHVPVGSIYGLIGENGAGKSTTQKMICGLLQPTSGEISLFGKSVNDADIRSSMGVLIENPGVYSGWTAQENLLMQAMNIGVDNPKRAVEWALEEVGLEGTAKKKVREFSLGMKQRLGIAAALLGSPSILVLDEPINGLDPEGIREIRQTLLRLNHVHQVTILISSHILGELSKIATYYGIIKDGAMVREVSGEELARECRDFMRVKVANPEKALPCLEERIQMDGAEIVGDEIHLLNARDGASVNRCLFQNGYVASEISFHQLDLEEYFVRLMGGDEDE